MNAVERIDAVKAKFRDGRRSDAVAECEALCKAEPGNIVAKRLCGMMHALMGTHARAIELLAEVIEHAPGDGDVLFNLGLCERELGNFGAAGSRFKSYTQRFPGREDGVAALASCHAALLQRASQQEKAGNLELAARDYRAALSLQPRPTKPR